MTIEAFALVYHTHRVQVEAMGNETYRVAELGALIGDPARASMLTELMSGRALTAGELASVAHISPQTVSTHLQKLEAAHLIRSERQGRHRYVAIASREVAHMLETMYSISAAQHKPLAKPPRVFGALKRARTCYDHLAGELGVALCDVLTQRKLVVLHEEAAELTKRGLAFAADFGLDVELHARSRRPLCKTCLDWSERRYHLAGRFGAALADALFKKHWLERISEGRALTLTAKGLRGLQDTFGIHWTAFEK